MDDDNMQATVHVCGPQGRCGCECPDGPCGHDFGGDKIEVGGGAYSVACQKCGMLAITHDMWVAP